MCLHDEHENTFTLLCNFSYRQLHKITHVETRVARMKSMTRRDKINSLSSDPIISGIVRLEERQSASQHR